MTTSETNSVSPEALPANRLSRILAGDRGGQIMLGIVAAIAIAVPIGNLAVPEGAALHVPGYTVSLIGKYLCFALLALALDLVWGYCGLLSLGHGAFFSLGGYAMGMYLMREANEDSVPNFMSFLEWQSYPWYWFGFDIFPFAALMILVAPGVLAFVFGWLAFRSRVSGVYFSIMSQAMVFAMMLAFNRQEMGFGGTNGLKNFDTLLGFDLGAPATKSGLLVASAIAVILGYIVSRYMTRSRAGRVLMAIRDAEPRVRSVGYRVDRYKLWAFTVSALLAGVAGALFVPQVGIITPRQFDPVQSIEVVVWVALGGRGTLYGALVGAGLVNWSKSLLTSAYPDAWLFVLGGLFVLVTLFLPRGVVGIVQTLRENGVTTLLKKLKLTKGARQ
jgi:urea transport system permease protein